VQIGLLEQTAQGQEASRIVTALLHCPIRGPLTAQSLAKDGLTPTEEARRIDFLHFLLDERDYPPENIVVETVVLRGLGAEGKNSLRADVIVYDSHRDRHVRKPLAERLQHVALVAEIKREAKSKGKGVDRQLVPALLILPNVRTLGVYWDDQNRDLFIKKLVSEPTPHIEIDTDTVANLPTWGQEYQSKPITVENLTQPANLVAALFELANIMRSHGVNDEQLRYRETVKLLLARYVDERQAKAREDGVLRLQVYRDADPTFMKRVGKVYADSANRYSHAKTLFQPTAGSELDERVLRPLVESIQGFDLSSASNETMQQVFMSFVPAVFKKVLSQYFTPISLIETVVKMVEIGPTDKIADPAMGTADFLTAAMAERLDDDDIIHRVFGIDSDEKAFDLAVVNMILNRDGQSGLICEDSIRNPDRWADEMNVVLCNPPFGSRTLETHKDVLAQYDLGHVWHRDDTGVWAMTDEILPAQQLGILFVERCWKMLRSGGRLGIIWPEGYLSTTAYTYVRKWVLDHFQIVALVELPRRIFTKSDADLRSNIMIVKKLNSRRPNDYPIHASLVRSVGYKLSGDFSPTPLRDPETGLEIRDDQNRIILKSDFNRTLRDFAAFKKAKVSTWSGARYSDISSRPDLDMKPRRLVPRALNIARAVRKGEHVRLGDIAEVVEQTVDLVTDLGPAEFRRPVEGQNIRAVEGIVSPGFPERCWSIAERKDQRVYELRHGDVIVGLVRPERRNVGVLLEWGDDIVGMRDAIAVVRVRPEFADEYSQEWLFTALRSEEARIQFWTESGGTSYGKLDLDQIRNVVLSSTAAERLALSVSARKWMDAVEAMHEYWVNVGDEDDRRPILNSPLIGLVEAEQEEEQEQTVKKNQPQDTSKEYDRFKELTRKLVAVPKSEIVEELEEDDLEQSED
jgi:type I restriction enzyme M protein